MQTAADPEQPGSGDSPGSIMSGQRMRPAPKTLEVEPSGGRAARTTEPPGTSGEQQPRGSTHQVHPEPTGPGGAESERESDKSGQRKRPALRTSKVEPPSEDTVQPTAHTETTRETSPRGDARKEGLDPTSTGGCEQGTGSSESDQRMQTAPKIPSEEVGDQLGPTSETVEETPDGPQPQSSTTSGENGTRNLSPTSDDRGPIDEQREAETPQESSTPGEGDQRATSKPGSPHRTGSSPQPRRSTGGDEEEDKPRTGESTSTEGAGTLGEPTGVLTYPPRMLEPTRNKANPVDPSSRIRSEPREGSETTKKRLERDEDDDSILSDSTGPPVLSPPRSSPEPPTRRGGKGELWRAAKEAPPPQGKGPPRIAAPLTRGTEEPGPSREPGKAGGPRRFFEPERGKPGKPRLRPALHRRDDTPPTQVTLLPRLPVATTEFARLLRQRPQNPRTGEAERHRGRERSQRSKEPC